MANPDLKPETLLNYEIGFDYTPVENFNIQLSGYYSSGYDFQYFAHTGDTVDEELPVVARENVSKASVLGTEVSVDWKILKNLSLKANYTYNVSKITEFISKTNNEQDDLTGKDIAETPPYQAYCGIFLKNKIANLSLVANYISAMWSDEFNTEKLDPYFLIDIGLEKQFRNFNFNLDIQNVLNIHYIDKKDGLAPGRFIMLELGYRFSSN
jgi:outer membrane receptor protein involved in Fe transport